MAPHSYSERQYGLYVLFLSNAVLQYLQRRTYYRTAFFEFARYAPTHKFPLILLYQFNVASKNVNGYKYELLQGTAVSISQNLTLACSNCQSRRKEANEMHLRHNI